LLLLPGILLQLVFDFIFFQNCILDPRLFPNELFSKTFSKPCVKKKTSQNVSSQGVDPSILLSKLPDQEEPEAAGDGVVVKTASDDEEEDVTGEPKEEEEEVKLRKYKSSRRGFSSIPFVFFIASQPCHCCLKLLRTHFLFVMSCQLVFLLTGNGLCPALL